MSLRRPLVIAGWCFIATASAWLIRFVFVYWDNPRFINFAAASIPTVLAILIAFNPNLREAGMRWKIAIVGIGFILSIIAWRQILVSEREQAKSGREQARTVAEAISAAVSQSVEKSNKHSDQHSEEQTEAVKKELHTGIKQFADSVTGEFTKDAATIAEKAKPHRPDIAKLTFSFVWPTLLRKDMPATTVHVHAVASVATVTFTLGNMS